jgi:type IV pilus assembly protein PilV
MTRQQRENRATAPRASGFSLIEVMISILVLALGLLGLAALQTFGIKYSNQSYERTQATLLIDDVVDHMRGNRNGVVALDYDNRAIAYNATPPSTNCGTGYVASASAQADCDVENWIAKLKGNPPTATPPIAQGSITIQPLTPGQTYEITVSWVESDITMSQKAWVRIL